MVRKRFNRALGLGLLFTGLTSQPSTVQAQTNVPAASKAATPIGATNTSSETGIWYQTASYVFQSDPDLRAVADKLVKKLNPRSIESFRRSLEDAVAAEGKPLKDSHVATFQKTFKQLQGQQHQGVPGLLALIEASPIGKKRKDDPKFQALLNRMATPVSTASAAGIAVPDGSLASDSQVENIGDTPDEAPAEYPASRVAVAPSPPAPPSTGWVSWLPLLLSGLSLAGVLYLLLNRPKHTAAVTATLPTSPPEPAGRRSTQKDVTWDEVKKYVDRQLAEHLKAAAIPPVLVAQSEPPVVPPLPAPPLPTPQQRIQYSTEAPFNNFFLARSLSEQPSTYSMFALMSSDQQPEQATFAVTGNLANHVREHRSVLEPACDYANFPVGNETRIITEEPGQLRRQGQDWAVISRARIRFEV